MRHLAWSFATVVLALGALGGCGGTAASVEPAFAKGSVDKSAATPPPIGDHTLARSAVHAAVVDGLGAFLQRVDIDDQPVMTGGKFHGFRIAGLRDASFWAGVDLKPGDVVTAVNGMPIERPEQAQTALESLEAAKELRVAFDRDGQPHELVYAIVDGR
jgi:type II secretory pathway component PulC